jgi:hypothetical protein
LVLVPMLAVACDKATPDTQPPTTTEQPTAQTKSGVWGDGTVRGTVTLKWGAPATEGSTLQLRVYRGGDIVHQHDMPVSGAGPWDFEFKVDDTSSFAEGQMFGVGATIVAPNGESWYRGDPLSVPIWQAEGQASAAITISPINSAAAGDGPPK